MSKQYSEKKLRRTVYDVLENNHHQSAWSMFIDYFLIALIIANVIAVMAESMSTLYSDYKIYFDYFDQLSIAIFLIEYLLRWWAIVEAKPEENAFKQRWQWMKSPYAIIDLLVIVPSFIAYFVAFDLRFLRVLRLFRLLKLTRYFSALQILLIVMRRERGSFQAVLFILIIMLVMASSGIYLAENRVQPEQFESIPKSMWWAVATLTTVGYGDVVPVTMAGKIFGAMITILGVGLAALPAGILASGLAAELTQRREELEQTFREMLLEDCMDVVHNQDKVEKLRKELGISQEVAQTIELQVLREIDLAKRENAIEKRNFCPHCGESLR